MNNKIYLRSFEIKILTIVTKNLIKYTKKINGKFKSNQYCVKKWKIDIILKKIYIQLLSQIFVKIHKKILIKNVLTKHPKTFNPLIGCKRMLLKVVYFL